MSKKFYTSDLHIGHKAILTFDNRPFFTLKEYPYRCYNVGCMLHGYKPVTLEQLMKGELGE